MKSPEIFNRGRLLLRPIQACLNLNWKTKNTLSMHQVFTNHCKKWKRLMNQVFKICWQMVSERLINEVSSSIICLWNPSDSSSLGTGSRTRYSLLWKFCQILEFLNFFCFSSLSFFLSPPHSLFYDFCSCLPFVWSFWIFFLSGSISFIFKTLSFFQVEQFEFSNASVCSSFLKYNAWAWKTTQDGYHWNLHFHLDILGGGGGIL